MIERLIPAILLTLLCAGGASAQSADVRPSFEAASVKPAKPDGSGAFPPLRGGPGTSSPGQLSGAATLKALLMRAYDLKEYQVLGPSWIGVERYEITAKIPANSTREQVAAMLRTLLTERFHLTVRRTSRQVPVYILAVGKNGPMLKESADRDFANEAAEGEALTGKAVPKVVAGPDGMPDLAPGSALPRSYEVVVAGSDGILYKLWARRESMQQLADRLSSHLNRAVVDMTGLKKQYDFKLAWTMESSGGGVPRTYPPPDQIESISAPVGLDSAMSLFSAVQSQLGLTLKSKRGPLDVLIVEKADRTPVEN